MLLERDKVTYLFLLLLLVTLSAFAKTDSINPKPNLAPQKIVTLPELTDLALTLNPNTHLAWAEVKEAAAGIGIAHSAYYPNLSANLGLQIENATLHGRKNNSVVSGNTFLHSANITYGPNLSLNYLLLDFGARKATFLSAKFQYLASRFTQDATLQQVILQVDQAYYQTLAQQALVKAYQENLKETQISLNAANALYHHGLATVGDVYQAKSVLAQAVLTLKQAEGNLAIAQGQLTNTIGLPIQQHLLLPDVPQHIDFKPMMTNIGELVKIAKQNRPDLRSAEAQVNSAQQQVIASDKQFWPTIQISGTGIQNYPNGSVTNNGLNTTAMVTLNVPIFTGFSHTYTVRQSQAQAEEALANRDILANQINMQVWQSYYTLQTAYQSIQSSDALLLDSLKASAQALGQYRAGVGNILNVLTTQTTLANARAQSIQAKLNWFLALAQLSQSLGTITATPPTIEKIGSA